MARANLSQLLDNLKEDDTATEPADSAATNASGPVASPVSITDHAKTASKATAKSTKARQTRTATAVSDVSGPHYLSYTRKEARLTDAQLDDLARLTRRLNKARKGAGERLTDNSLIRIAVDLLLERQDELSGASEPELRKSVGL